MKKITLLFMSFLMTGFMWSQCVNSTDYLTPTAVNDGTVEQIATCTYSTEYNTIDGLIVGDDYTFIATAVGVDAYVSITDLNDVSIAFGPSPLTVSGISSADVRLHVTADETCAGGSICHVTSFQNLTVAAAACDAPTDLTASNISDVAADLTWVEPALNVVSYNVEVYLTGESAVNGDTAVFTDAAATGTTILATGLAESTDYDAFISTNCDGTTPISDVSAAVTFSTTAGCSDVSGVAIETIRDISADVVFTPGTGNDSFIIEVYLTGESAANGDTPVYANPAASGSPEAVTGLVAETGYDAYVTGSCGATATATQGPTAFTTAPTPPANDECDAAIALTVNADLECTSVTSGTIEFATASGLDETSCFGTEDDDVWFSFVAGAATHAIDLTNVANGTTDLYHSVWSGTCAGLTNLSCSDPNSSTVSGLTIGETYFLRVYSWTATPGQTTTFDVCIGTLPPPPANDACVNAITVFDGDSVSGDTTVATNVEGLTACNGGGGSASTGCEGGTGTMNFGAGVWYVYTGQFNESITLTTDNSPAGFDTEIQVFTGDCSTLVCLGGDDDGGANGAFSTFCFESTAESGSTVDYYIYVDGHSTNTGNFILDVSVAQTLSVDSLENENAFTYFPNPVKNELTLNAQNNINNVQVLNMLGQEVLRTAPNSVNSTIDMNELSQGAYFVKVTIGNVTETIRVIKQ